MVPLLEVLARHELPWWCYARADALVNLSPETWRLVRKSRLRMAYIGAETPNDRLLKSIRKGTRSEQTLEVTEVCRAQRRDPRAVVHGRRLPKTPRARPSARSTSSATSSA